MLRRRSPSRPTLSERTFVPLLAPGLLELGPAVVGATGGSGTRVVARILRRAGLFTGSELNESEDAWKLGDYSDRWINEYLSHREPLPDEVEQAMLEDLSAVLADHCSGLDSEPRPWGWKEPRSIYLLRFYRRHLPAIRFLHVVRDGRDMALSENQNQLRKHGGAAPIPADHLSPAARSIALWSWVNLEAARYGEEHLGDRYLRVRFEDLCESPAAVAGRILAFFELDADPGSAVAEVVTPASLGRWRSEGHATLAELERVGGQALIALGYDLTEQGLA